jgi:hypothetical protein
MSALLDVSRLICTAARGLQGIGDRLYNIATRTRFRRTDWDHERPVWSAEFYRAFGEQEYAKFVAALSGVQSPEFFRVYGEREWHRLHPRKSDER